MGRGAISPSLKPHLTQLFAFTIICQITYFPNVHGDKMHATLNSFLNCSLIF